MQTANISAPEQSDEENASGGDSDEGSAVSSLGPWGDDPEIQEKVRYSCHKHFKFRINIF